MAKTKFLKLFLPSVGSDAPNWSVAADQINQNFSILDNHLNLISRGALFSGGITEILYGLTAKEDTHSSDETTAKNSARTAFSDTRNITEKNGVSLTSGAFVDFATPDVAGFYRAFIAVRSRLDSNLKFYNNENLTDLNWVFVESVNFSPIDNAETVEYNLYVRKIPYNHSQTNDVIVKAYT